MNKCIQNNTNDISNLKDAVAKKANYTDLVDLLDRKADKH